MDNRRATFIELRNFKDKPYFVTKADSTPKYEKLIDFMEASFDEPMTTLAPNVRIEVEGLFVNFRKHFMAAHSGGITNPRAIRDMLHKQCADDWNAFYTKYSGYIMGKEKFNFPTDNPANVYNTRPAINDDETFI